MYLIDYLDSRLFTQKEFARLAKVSPSSISNYINGRKMPKYEIAVHIEKITNGLVTQKEQRDWFVKMRKK